MLEELVILALAMMPHAGLGLSRASCTPCRHIGPLFLR